jgi:hypothetical protein
MHVHTELLCALPPQPVQLRWAKTISLSQTAVFWHFFIQILVCRITYDHPWRSSYKIVNQACYNMVPTNLLVSCVIHPQRNHNGVSKDGALVGVWGHIIKHLQARSWHGILPTDLVIVSILLGFISFHKHLHCKVGPFWHFPYLLLSLLANTLRNPLKVIRAWQLLFTSLGWTLFAARNQSGEQLLRDPSGDIFTSWK